MPEIKIANIEAIAELMEIRLDQKIIRELPGILYDKEKQRFYIHDKTMKGKVFILPPNKMISIGTKSEEDAKSDLRHVADLLVNTVFKRKIRVEGIISNIAATARLEKSVDLNALAEKTPSIKYNPKTFPGAMYEVPDSPAKVLIFETGKIVITGCHTIEQIKAAFSHVKKLVNSV